MASPQPQSGGRIEALSDVTYDLVTELSQEAEAIDVLNQYIEDARRANNLEALRVFEQIRDDEIRHSKMLKQVIEDHVKRGIF